MRKILFAVLGLLVIAYAVGLALNAGTPTTFVDVWLSGLTQIVPAAVVWVAVYRSRFARLDVLLAASAMSMSALGDIYFTLAMDADGDLAFPSTADVGYLLFYPLILGAMVCLVYRQLRGVIRSVVLDSAVASFGAAAVLAALLSPILTDAAAGPASLPTMVAVAYPLFDVVIVAVVVGIAAAPSLDVGPRWVFLVSGLLILTAADVVYALIELDGSYAVGTPLDAGWAIGLALIAVWGDGLERPAGTQHRHGGRVSAVAVPVFAVASGLGVLIVGTQLPLAALALVLASCTVALAAVPLVLSHSVLHRETRTDELTGLPNRRAFYLDAPLLLTAAKGEAAGSRCALMLLDLDKFKDVNDSLGHEIGDRLLVQVSGRMSESLRPGDLLARLGGDEFAVVLRDSGEEEAVAAATKLRSAISGPFSLGGTVVETSVSIGIALFPEQGDDFSGLLRRADLAMYTAKAARSGHHVFKQADDADGELRQRTLRELRLALKDGQLVVHYQPKITLGSGEVTGVEALVRWNHPTRGLLLPDSFLLLIEEDGLMGAMTDIVLAAALDQAAAWRSQGRNMTVAVNMSASSLVDMSLPERISAIIDARGLPGAVLVLEITEDFLIADREQARKILSRLRAAGIRVSVDDFGTGYSSLSYLRDLPIDELKLDRSFIRPMAEDARAAALVASTINLAHSLGLRMVAEGVEDGDALADLERFGCDYAQGYYLSHPLPAAELDLWLEARQLPVAGYSTV